MFNGLVYDRFSPNRGLVVLFFRCTFSMIPGSLWVVFRGSSFPSGPQHASGEAPFGFFFFPLFGRTAVRFHSNRPSPVGPRGPWRATWLALPGVLFFFDPEIGPSTRSFVHLFKTLPLFHVKPTLAQEAPKIDV